MTDLRFRIYYGWLDPQTGEVKTWTFEGAGTADAIMAPRSNVQVVVNEEPWREKLGKRGRGLQHGNSHYVWRDDMGWDGVSDAGEREYLRTYKLTGCVSIKGWTQRDEAYHECIRRATHEGLGDGDERTNA